MATTLEVWCREFSDADLVVMERGGVQKLELMIYEEEWRKIRRPLRALLHSGTVHTLTIGGDIDAALNVVGDGLGYIKNLNLLNGQIGRRAVAQVAGALGTLRALRFSVMDYTAVTFKNLALPMLKRTECSLVKLHHWEQDCQPDVQQFRKRVAVFALLYGSQVRHHNYCPLQRLPVEMFRLVRRCLGW